VIETLLIATLGYLALLAFGLALLRTAARAERAAERQRLELWTDEQPREHRRHRSAV
jgi:hypothetical protein